MKKTFVALTLLAGALTGYSQGQIQFYNYGNPLGLGRLAQAIFSPSTPAASTYAVTYGGYTVMEEIGSTSATVESPKGTTVYTGTALTGSAYSGQLLAGPAGITSVDGTVGGASLTPVGNPLTFRISPAGMLTSPETITLPTETYFTPGDLISVAIASWANSGPYGAATSLAEAQADGYKWGISPVEQITQPLGGTTPSGDVGVPAPMPTTILSFSLGVAVPEPSVSSLAFVGFLALVPRRRNVNSC